MAITAVQTGTPGTNTGTTGPTSATLASTPTAGNLLIVACSLSVGFPNLIGPAGYSLAGYSQDGPPVCAVYYKVAGAGESTTVSMSSSTSGGHDIQVWEFSTGGLRLRPDAQAGLAFGSTAGPVTVTAGPASRSGLALGVTVWKGSNALTGFAAAGWTVGTSGNGARGFQTFTSTAGTSTLACAASWSTARSGEGFTVMFTPSAAGPVIAMLT